MRIALTGGTGYVGRFIHVAARAAGHEVVLLSRRDPGQEQVWQPYALDAPPPRLTGFDALVHAAFDHVPGKYRGGEGDDPAGFLRRNLDGSIALFGAALRDGVGRVIFLSSRAVYGGYPPGTPLKEAMSPRPDTLYGQAKAGAEAALAAQTAHLDVAASLRATGVYGRPAPGLAHKWEELFRDYLAGLPVSPRAGTELHGADLADAVLRLLGAGRAIGAFNASDLLVDRHDLLAEVGRLTGSTVPPPPQSATAVSVMECRQLRNMGWRPRGWDGLRAALPDLLPDPPPFSG